MTWGKSGRALQANGARKLRSGFHSASRLGSAALGAVLALATSGCLQEILVGGQLKSTRTGAEAVSTIQDFEVARTVAQANLGTMEGMHSLQPDNTDGLYLLTRTWAGAAAAFFDDDYETAMEKGKEELAEYHRLRVQSGHARAKFYGIKLLSANAGGFKEASKNANTLRAWLVKNFKHKREAPDLLWTGFAWVSQIAANTDDPEKVGELYIGAEIVKRSVELDEELEHGMGHTILGAYHARTAHAELDEAKKHFDRALEINGGRFLNTKLNLATRYYCNKSDRANYEKLLKEILAADDPLPEARLQNTIAKRKAQRYLAHDVFQEDCGFTS